MLTPTELAEAIGKMQPQHMLAACILILAAVPCATALLIWIFDRLERAMKAMAGNKEQP
jgi:hypothetical protein